MKNYEYDRLERKERGTHDAVTLSHRAKVVLRFAAV